MAWVGRDLEYNLVILLRYSLQSTISMFLVSIFVIFPRKEKGHIAEIPFFNFLHLIKIECKKSHASLPAIMFIIFTKIRLIFNFKINYIVILDIKII